MKKKAEKLTTYDPAEDLGSDEAIATFMAEALETNDVAYIAHAVGVVARAKGVAQLRSKQGCLANSSTALSVKEETRR